MQLRPYQQRAIDHARRHYANGARSILLVAPTGAGKTIIGTALALSHVGRGGRVLWLAHRQELIQQAADAIARAGEIPGVIAPWAPSSPRARVQVASVQTLVARGDRPEASAIVLDEAHHHVAAEWGTVAESYVGNLRIGLTATPEREDGVGLGNLFDALVAVAQPRELIDLGYLVPCTVLRPTRTTKALAEDPVEAYRRFAPGEKAIVFASTVAAARKLAERFDSIGSPARAITGDLGSADRDVAIDRFRTGSVRVLVGVHTLTEGLDVPDASCAILARGFSSPGAYIQAVGRVLRPAPGKARAVVVDLMGASIEHGLPDEDRSYSLEGRAIRSADGALPIRQCPACGRVFRAALFRSRSIRDGMLVEDPVPTCPGCQATMPMRPDPAVRRQRIEAATASHTSTRKVEALQQLLATARAKGHKPGWAWIQFKVRYKRWPNVAEKVGAGWR